MKKLILVGLLSLSFISKALIYENCYFVDFDQSMNRYKKITLTGHANLNIFRALFEKYKLENIMPDKEPRIPKIIHQIWLGGRMPSVFKPLIETWLKNHPSWQYKLWTDADIESFHLENQELYNAAKNYGQRSDILRYEILYRYGGLYIDVDFKCIKPFDLLHHCYDFYTGLFDIATGTAANGLIGCAPDHPIMKEMIKSLKTISKESEYLDIIKLTGPDFFTNIFLKTYEQSPGRAIVFPCTFFYPSPNTAQFAGIIKQSKYIQPESLAIHFWACSWQDPEAYVKD